MITLLEINYREPVIYGINSIAELIDSINDNTIVERAPILQLNSTTDISCTLSANDVKIISTGLYRGEYAVRPAKRANSNESIEVFDLVNKKISIEYCNEVLRNIFYAIFFNNDANIEDLTAIDYNEALEFLKAHKAIFMLLRNANDRNKNRVVVMNQDESIQIYGADANTTDILYAAYDAYRNTLDFCEGVPAYYNEYNSRFKGAKWINEVRAQTLAVVGCGGIGSYLVFLLSRLDPKNILLYDNDVVEAGNLSGQFFRAMDIGALKINAAMTVASSFSSYYKFVTFTQAVNEDTSYMSSNCVFTGLDNMTARKSVYESAFNRNNVRIIIDGRLGFNEFQVFFVDLEDEEAKKAYEERWLFSDEEMEETVCTMKQTSFMANMIASVMVNLFINYCASLNEPEGISALPFMTAYDAMTMNFKTYSPHESLSL